MNTKKKAYIFIFATFIIQAGFAQSNLNTQLKLDFPLFDLPYQIDAANTAGNFFAGYSTLSMNQSLALTADVYSAMHFGMKKLHDWLPLGPEWKTAIYYGGTAAGLLAFGYILPFGYPWFNQEFTRSVLTRFGINSVNGRYNILDTSYVIGFTDSQLESLKRETPYNMVRMEEAKIESYVLFSDHMLRNIFFYNLDNLSNWTALISTFLGSTSNVGVGISTIILDSNAIVDNAVKESYEYESGSTEKSRMLYVAPAVNWVYDLFRPGEPYSARGNHPSGHGIARYISMAQLTGKEKEYLIKQGWLHFFNYFSPLLYGFRTIPLGNTGFEWNAAFHHYLTSFGADVPVQIFLKKAPFNMLFTYHSYMNYEHYFPAIEAELADFPLRLGGLSLYLSPRVLAGMQPRDQNFMTGEPEFLGLLGCRVDFAVSKHFLPYIDLSAKTDGWVAGNEYLEPNVSFKAGLSMRF